MRMVMPVQSSRTGADATARLHHCTENSRRKAAPHRPGSAAALSGSVLQERGHAEMTHGKCSALRYAVSLCASHHRKHTRRITSIESCVPHAAGSV